MQVMIYVLRDKPIWSQLALIHSLTVTQNFKPYIFILNLTHQFFVPPTLLNKAHSNMLFSSIEAFGKMLPTLPL